MYRTREELLDQIAKVFEDCCEDPDDGWSTDGIADNIWRILINEDNIISECEVCGQDSRASLDECPWSSYHRCEECGNYNDECECEDEPTPTEQIELDTAPPTEVCIGCHHLVADCVCPKVVIGL